MKLETFFEKFEQFAATPGQISQIRKTILGLAVLGRLTKSSRKDGAADSLLEKIDESVAAYRKNSTVRTRRVKSTEQINLPQSLPKSWTWANLGRLSYQITDGVHKTPTYVSEGIPFLSIKDISSGFIDFSDTRFVTHEAHRSMIRRCHPEHGDLLFTRIGTLGKTVTVNTHKEFSLFVSVGLIKFPQDLVISRYLEIVLNSPIAHYQYELIKAGGSHTNKLNLGPMHSVQIPLPPLPDQKRIVAKVDDLLTLCDRLEAQQQDRETRHAALARAALARFAEAPTPSNLGFLFHKSYDISPADLRKSILTLAVQGKLVPQDPADEPVETLLARNDTLRCKTAQNDRRAKAQNQTLLSADDRWEIASTWQWRGLADLVLFVDYRGKTPVKLSSGIRLLTAKNVRDGRINLLPEEFLSETDYHTWMTRGLPKAGDVLFTTEAPMGNAAVIKLTERFALAQRVICFQGYGALDTAFLVLQILSEQFQLILNKNGTGMTAKGIKASKLKRLPIAVPPLSEQRRIVAKVDQLMALVDQLEAQLTQSRSTGNNLLEAVVTEMAGNSHAACI